RRREPRWSAARSRDTARREAACRRWRRRSRALSTAPTRRSAGRRRNARISLGDPGDLALGRQRHHLRLDLDAGPDPHQPVDDDRLVAGESFANDAVAMLARAGADRLGADIAFRVDDIDDAAVLIGADRLVGHHDAPVGEGTRYVDAAE